MSKTFIACLLLLVLTSHSNSLAADVINAGIGGNRSSQLLKRLDHDVLAKHPTTVVVMVGTNDRLNSGGFIDIKTYRINVERLITKIRAGDARVLLITPPTCIPELLYTRHDKNKYADQSPVERMKEVRMVLLEIAREKRIPVIDFHDYLIKHKIADDTKISVIRNPANSGSKDGVHLTPAGYQLLAQLVAEKFTTEKLDTTNVVCFGDSLTKGSKKSNYPAYLDELIKKSGNAEPHKKREQIEFFQPAP